jgi:N-acetylmuramoyl-L-alanine amidase
MNLTIQNDLLFKDRKQVPFVETPNRDRWDTINAPKFIVIHCTAGDSAQNTVDLFKMKNVYASAHLIIGKDGEMYQMIPFSHVAWHAGPSSYPDPDNPAKTLTDLNEYSIGIEIDNWGGQKRLKAGREMILKDGLYWEVYTQAQIDTVTAICRVLVATYGYKAIVGHADIAPSRRSDPGPLWPMAQVRHDVFGTPVAIPEPAPELTDAEKLKELWQWYINHPELH